MPGSFVSTHSSRAAASGVPSATITCPACSELPIPTPPPWWKLTQLAPLATFTIALRIAQSAIASGVNQYPPGPGTLELRVAIAAHQKRFWAIDLDPPTEVLVTAGATEAIAASVLALCDPGDEILAFEPTYDSYTAVAAMAGPGGDTTLPTTVVLDGDAHLVLVGGGDMMLAAGAGDPDAVNGRAGLGDLADQVAAQVAGANPEVLLVAGRDVEPDLLAAASTLGSGTRAIGVYRQRWAEPGKALSVYLDGVRDPGNVGAIVRAAHALCDGPVVLGPGCADPYSPKAVRASMGSVFARPPARAKAAEAVGS